MARDRHPTAVNNSATNIADTEEPEAKKNKPKDTRLRQQRLPAWQPILNAKTVIPVFFGISILFIPLGIVLLVTSSGVKENAGYYDDKCDEQIRLRNDPNDLNCTIRIVLDEDFTGDVYFYYGLENYYQNHRRYMRSRNDKQLLGNLESVDDCAPYAKVGDLPVAPCGAIANSMFNDTFKLFDQQQRQIQWSYDELIWPIDRKKFRNPLCAGQIECPTQADLCNVFSEAASPPNWVRRPCLLDTAVNNSGFQNADFIIWMRTAAFPDFRKPYRKLNDPNYANGLPRGNYMLKIENFYNVSSFSGRKAFIISTTSWLGGKNAFLGMAYIAVGLICAIIGIAFIFVHIRYGHSLPEMAGIDHIQQQQQQHHNHQHPNLRTYE